MKNLTYANLKKSFLLCFLFLAAAISASACGRKTEPVVTQLGVDGYVYLPEKIATINCISTIKRYGDFLYYQDGGSICKISLISTDDESGLKCMPDLSDKTSAPIPQSTSFSKISAYPTEAPHPIFDALREQILASGMESYTFSLKDFAADSEGNLYYYIEASVGGAMINDNIFTMEIEPLTGMLYKQSPEGDIVYGLSLPFVTRLAIDHDSNIYALSQDGIYIINEQGQQTGRINLEEYRIRAGESLWEQLLEDNQGHVYYILPYQDLTQTVAEISLTPTPHLEEISGLLNEGWNDIFPVDDGKLLISDYNKGVVYTYEKESSSKKTLLRWEDINLHASQFRHLLMLTPDILLATCNLGSDTGLYLLTKTPVSELPEKELVVLASLSPTNEVQKSVIDFNQFSSKYHVIIETYGSSYDESAIRLDATLVSAAPPDILDLDDVYKYTSQDMLEDLTPYLENSAKVPLDDFLDNVLEGYTIDDRLVCVPTTFSVFLPVGRASQLEELGLAQGWTMEDAYQLTERYPGSLLLHSGCDLGPEEREQILDRFCYAYYLEKFIDWETGTCSFDSDEFRQMLLWVDSHAGEQAILPANPSGQRFVKPVFIPENALLVLGGFNNFKIDLVQLEYQFQEEIRLLGLPTADGRLEGLLYPHDALGIVSNARNKDGAWAFLEYFLSSHSGNSQYFPTRKSLLKEMYQNAITPPEQDTNGEYMMRGIRSYYGGIDGAESELYTFTPERLARLLLNAIETMDFSPLPANAQQVKDIVTEELESYYNGDKSLEEVTRIIQNRVQLLLQESIS